MQLTRRHVAVATSVLLVITGLGSFDARAQSGGIVIPEGIPMHLASPADPGDSTTGRPLAALQAAPAPTSSSGRFPPGIELPPGIPVHWPGGASPVATTVQTATDRPNTPSATGPTIPAGIPRHVAGASTPTATTQRPMITAPPTITTTTTTTSAPPIPTSTTAPPTTTIAPAPAATTTTPTPAPTTTSVPAPDGWHAPDHIRRIELTVQTAGTVQSGDVVAVPLDVVDLVGFDAITARAFAVDDSGEIVTADIPSQLIDDALHPELLLDWPDLSPVGDERRFQLYLAAAGAAPIPTRPAPRIQVFPGTDEGLGGHAIQTETGRWFLDSDGGGFSSLDDANGNDWIGWNDAPGDAGRFRGIPNLVFPEGHFHPGNGGSTTRLISSGPLGVRFRSVTNDGAWAIRYDLDPRRLRMTVELAAHDYWVLYEGTPGGSLQSGQDRVVKADSTTVDGGGTFSGDLAPDDWMAITDTSNLGSLILGAMEADTVGDRYSSIGSMAIAGLGRVGDSPALTEVDRQYIVALTPTVAVGTLSRRARALVHPPERTAMNITDR